MKIQLPTVLLTDITSNSFNDQDEQARYHTPEKNKSKPCNYGPEKKKKKSINDA